MISRKLLFGLIGIFLASASLQDAFGRERADAGLPSTTIVSADTQNEVFIHIRSANQRMAAKRIQERLQEEGYSVPRVILVGFGPNRNEIRYFHRDRAQANLVLQDIRGLGLGRIELKSIGHYADNPPGRYELWLSPGTR